MSCLPPSPRPSLRPLVAPHDLATDDAAFGRWLVAHTPALRAVARGVLRGAPGDVVEDVVQSAFLAAFRARAAAPATSAADASRWLFAVAGNVARNVRRARARFHARVDLPGDHVADDAPAVACPPDDALALRRALATLPSDDAAALALYAEDSLTLDEVARALGLSRYGAWSRCEAARAHLCRHGVSGAARSISANGQRSADKYEVRAARRQPRGSALSRRRPGALPERTPKP